MDLKDIASISGKSGLYKVVKPTRTGVILEAIDAQKLKVVANANNRVSLLKEISVYTTGEESSKPLEEIFEKIHSTFGDKIGVDSKSTPQELTSFLEKVVPDYDTEKVYVSDIKKIVTWYSTLATFYPERFIKSAPVVAEKSGNSTEALEEVTAGSEESQAKKPKPKKAPAKKKTQE